jgi:ABC-type protease/lipase transport system fused ATPase/permease subunit
MWSIEMRESTTRLIKSFFSVSPDTWEYRAAMLPLYVAVNYYAGPWIAAAIIFVSVVCGLAAWATAKVVPGSSRRRLKNPSEQGLRL